MGQRGGGVEIARILASRTPADELGLAGADTAQKLWHPDPRMGKADMRVRAVDARHPAA